MWFCYKQNGKEVRSTTNLQTKHWIVKFIDKYPPPFKNGEIKITDWITSQKPNCLSHPINLNNNITDISQKKDLPKSANDTIIYLLSLWYKQWKVEVAYSTMQHDTTLDAPKTFEWHLKQSSNKSIMSSYREETQNASE